MVSEVEQYFSDAARSYDKRSRKRLWAWQRRREAKAVMKLLGNVDGDVSLDLGCGSGYYTRQLLEQGARQVTAIDFSSQMLSTLPIENVRHLHADAATFTDEIRAASIICAGLLEFVDQPVDVLTNARRHATRNARLVCLVPPPTWPGGLYKRFHARHGLSINLISRQEMTAWGRQTGWRPDTYQFVWPYSLIMRFINGEAA
jgi:ubiquinone/menaquinone biosynthesis C-methylase UbiE